jgi:hypothetical protein
LDCGGLTPLWIFPISALTPHPKLRQAGALQDTPSLPQNALGNCETLSQPFRTSASPREIPDPGFLDCGGLTPLWIFPSTRSIPTQSPVKPEHSRTPTLPQNTLGNCGTLSQPFRTSASSRLRVRFRILVSWTAVA